MTATRARAPEPVSWWRKNVPALVTWGLLALGFAGTYALKIEEVNQNTLWRQEHERDYQLTVRRVDDTQRRLEVVEGVLLEGKAAARDTSEKLARIDKQISALVPQIQALAEQMKDFARKLDKER